MEETEASIVQDFVKAQDKNYRSPVYLEKQFLGTKDTSFYLDKKNQETLKTYGLDLTITQRRALTAIQILFAETNYQGNKTFIDINSNKLHSYYKCSNLDISFYAYFKAYGLTDTEIKRRGKTVSEALNALYSLEEDFRIAYTKEVVDTRTKEVEIIAVCANIKLINIAQMVVLKKQALEISEIEKYQRAKFLRIIIGPLLLEQIKSFYTLKPYCLNEEFESIKKDSSRKRSNLLFVDWILTINLSSIKITEENLSYKLRLESLIKARQKNRVKKIILEAITIAEKLNFLKSWNYNQKNNVYQFQLNPERCSRIKDNFARQKQEINIQALQQFSSGKDRGF